MRLCRFGPDSSPRVGLYDERGIVALDDLSGLRGIALPQSSDILDYLPPGGVGFPTAKALTDWAGENYDRIPENVRIDPASANVLVPVPRPAKIFLLAGNYAEHIQEGGGIAEERENTFPYVFMKPPTTLAHPSQPIRIPKTAPDAVDWELELGVVIGRTVKDVSEADALKAVAGYTIVNDISQRRYRPNPNRKPRDRDTFFDWLHGKWFDTFCPVGPCITSADALPDPQSLRLTLKLNDAVKQDSRTARMIFPVAAIIAFLSRMVTLEPGDIISTGTPAGVGATTGTFLKPGDVMAGHIERIGTLVTAVAAE